MIGNQRVRSNIGLHVEIYCCGENAIFLGGDRRRAAGSSLSYSNRA